MKKQFVVGDERPAASQVWPVIEWEKKRKKRGSSGEGQRRPERREQSTGKSISPNRSNRVKQQDGDSGILNVKNNRKKTLNNGTPSLDKERYHLTKSISSALRLFF